MMGVAPFGILRTLGNPNETFPAVEDVEAGVQYGVDGTQYTGTLATGDTTYDAELQVEDVQQTTDNESDGEAD